MPAVDIDFDELERASAALQHSIYDTDQFDANQFWYRESLNTGYDFRLGPRDPELPQPSCRIDQDESGDFDPSGKQIQPVVPPKRRREPALPQLDENGQPVAKKLRQATWQFGRFNGYSLPITLKVTSVRGLYLLASGTDNWPADDEPESSNSSHGQDSIFTLPSNDTSNTSIESYADTYTFRPRDKACYDCCDQKDVDDEFDLSKITLGHPAARGFNHAVPVPQSPSNASPVRLVAGPVPGHVLIKLTQLRLFESRLAAALSTVLSAAKLRNGAPYVLVNLVLATDAKLPAFPSLRSHLDKREVHLDIIPAKEHLQSKAKRPVFDDPFATVIPQPFSKTITTRLAHPINFNFTPSNLKDKPYCHWCDNVLHGLLGLGTLTVTVMTMTTISGRESTDGYAELDGGHTSFGYLPSRMCHSCTLQRFTIIGCESHDFSMLSLDSSKPIEQDHIVEVLSGQRQAEWEWCSICPSPALYGCCHSSCVWLEDAGEDLETVGCGLKLCEECTVLLTECEGNLEVAVWRKMEEAMGQGNEYIVRADAEFLTRGGELMRQAGGGDG
ncbi:MAG: hypothetical protein Q9209_002385 [Squamulea sp. 1 TL-2023]